MSLLVTTADCTPTLLCLQAGKGDFSPSRKGFVSERMIQDANLVFLHSRRQPFPSFPELAEALQVVWPLGEAATISEIVERLGERCVAGTKSEQQPGKGVLMQRPVGICSLI